jgi:hypothetical protein
MARERFIVEDVSTKGSQRGSHGSLIHKRSLEESIDHLFYTLFCKGFTPRESLLFVEDVVNIVIERDEVSAQLINSDLKKKGWHKAGVDPLTFELIIEFLESHRAHEADRLATH